jgi:hypothetical protein
MHHHHHHDLPAAEGLPVLVYRANYRAHDLTSQQQPRLPDKSSQQQADMKPPPQQQQQVCPSLLPLVHKDTSAIVVPQETRGEAAVGNITLQTFLRDDASSTTSSSSSSESGPIVDQVFQVCDWKGEWCGNLGGMWSEVYKVTRRDPENVELAPWVLKRYRKYRRFSQLQPATAGNPT